MRIDNLKINAYGNIKNKDISLNKGINIIHGANESGKSTLLSYIVNSFYGISKTKDGREMSDYEKYKPWEGSEFSGRIKYTLNDTSQYEIFRDFTKKNPKIYNERLEDITDNFEIDKKDGSKFFIEQTGVDKQTYLSTVVSMQQEVRLEEKEQNLLIQKIANLAGTGEDNVSYKKALGKLQDKIRDEIGTNKTTQKPINIIEKEIEEINRKIEEIRPYKDKKYGIDAEKEELKDQIKELEIERKILQELRENELIENENKKEIQIKENNIKENASKVLTLKNKMKELEDIEKSIGENVSKLQSEIESKKQNQEENKEVKSTSKKSIYLVIAVALIIVAVVFAVIVKNYVLAGIPLVLSIIDVIILAITQNKKKREIQEQKNKQEENRIKISQEIENLTKELQDKEEEKRDLDSQISMIKGQLLLLENNNEQISAQVNKIKTDLLNTQNQDKNQIITKYQTKIPIEKINSIIDSNNLHSLEEQLNTNKIKLTGLEIEENTILPQLDNLVNLEERLEADRQKKTELLQREEVINLAIENLNKAYEEMKTTITPKFTNNLSEGIKEITNNKYEKVAINDENGMIIENARGEYIEANKLSTGTIDQLYLALRLSMIKDLSKETLPIILDETFAYFDNARLEKIIQYLNEKAKEHQTIIFTCTNREKEILDNLKIEYNYIEL